MAARATAVMRRAARVLALAGLAIAAVLAALYAAVCHTPAGREQVRSLAVGAANEQLRGRIAIRAIERLGLSGVRLRGIAAFDPQGARVLEVESLDVELSPLALLSGAVRVDRVAIAGVRADLADLGDGRGVLAAFAPRAPAEPQAKDEGAPPHVVVSSIALDDVAVAAERPGFGRAGVGELRARARFALRGAARAELHELRAVLLREDRPIGAIESARARFAAEGEASTLALRARVAQSSLSLDASTRIPSDPAFERSPIAVSLAIDAIDAALLAALGQNELADRLRAQVAVALSITGTPGALDAELALRSSAGTLHAGAKLEDRDRLALHVRADGLAPAEIWADAPASRIGLQLGAKLSVARAPEHLPFELHVSQASLDGFPLPELRAEGRVESNRLRDLSLRASGHGATLALAGDASAEQLDLRGTLRARSFRAAEASVEELDLKFGAQGPPTALRVDVQARGYGARYGEQELTRFELQARGGPRRYTMALDTALADAEVRLEAQVQRGERAVRLDADAHGAVRRRPFELQVSDAVIGYAGTVEVGRAVLRGLGQHVTVRGRYGASSRDRLDLHARLDLQALSRAFALDPAARGTAELELAARGTVAQPVVELSLRARDLGLEGKPALAATLDAALDARAGELRADARVQSGSALQLDAALAARFDRRARQRWPQALAAARFEGSLALAPLDLRWIDGWLQQPLPVHGSLAANAALAGTLDRPEITARVHGEIAPSERAHPIEIALDAGYANAAATLALSARDRFGPWIDGRAALTHPAQTLAQFAAPGAALAHEGEWRAALHVAPRELAALPVDAARLGEDLAPIRVGLDFTARHEPRAEPNAELAIRAGRPRRAAASEEGCADPSLELAADVRLAGGRADAQLALSSEAQHLISAKADAALALSPALAGTGSPAPGQAAVTLELDQLDVGALPRVCGAAQGRLSGRITARDPLGARPAWQVALTGEQLGFGTPSSIDFTLRGQADGEQARLQLSLGHEGTRSTAVARVPLRAANGSYELVHDAPFSARVTLDRLPIAALLPAGSAISRASGRLSGAVEASGTLQDPRLRGHIEPAAVALTITGLAQPLHGIEGRIAFTDRRVAIERLVARDRGGSLSLRGAADFGKEQGVGAELELTADKFPLRQEGQVAGELDARIHVQARHTSQNTRVHVRIEDAAAWVLGGEQRKGIALDPHPDIVDPRVQAVPPPPDDAASSRPLAITLDANDSFWVRRDDFAVKLSTQLEIRLEGGRARVIGPLRIHRGYLQLFGQTFDIDGKSAIEFTGSDPPDPVLDIQAGTTNRRSGARIDVRIQGRASAPELAFFIDESQVTAGDAATALFGGSRGGGGDDEAQREAKSFVAGMMAGVMAVSARRELGAAMPILMLEPDDKLSSTRVRAGFELDDLVPSFMDDVIRGVYVEGIFAGGSEEARTSSGVQGGVLLELYLPHDFVTSGQYGPGATWSLDVGWEP